MPSCLIETGFLSNQGEREKLVTVEYQQQVADGIARGIDLYFHPKTMYLTFDDGPYRERTDKVLTVLKERNIKATFFLVGKCGKGSRHGQKDCRRGPYDRNPLLQP